jgi:hypothetical protein
MPCTRSMGIFAWLTPWTRSSAARPAVIESPNGGTSATLAKSICRRRRPRNGSWVLTPAAAGRSESYLLRLKRSTSFSAPAGTPGALFVPPETLAFEGTLQPHHGPSHENSEPGAQLAFTSLQAAEF